MICPGAVRWRIRKATRSFTATCAVNIYAQFAKQWLHRELCTLQQIVPRASPWEGIVSRHLADPTTNRNLRVPVAWFFLTLVASRLATRQSVNSLFKTFSGGGLAQRWTLRWTLHSAEMMQINKETMCILFPTLTAVECLQGITWTYYFILVCSTVALKSRGWETIRHHFGWLVLGCINNDFCKQILILQHFSISTRFAFFCTAPNLNFAVFRTINFRDFFRDSAKFCWICSNPSFSPRFS